MIKKNIFFLLLLICRITWARCDAALQIILIPGGKQDASGRTIGDYYECGITKQFCESIAKALGIQGITAEVYTRSYHTADSYADASYVNQRQPQLVMYTHFYMQQHEIPSLHMFYYGNGLPTISLQSPENELCLISVADIHLYHARTIEKMVKRWIDFFAQKRLRICYQLFTPVSVPLKELKGMYVPAMVLEVGIADHKAWQKIVEDCAHALAALLKADG